MKSPQQLILSAFLAAFGIGSASAQTPPSGPASAAAPAAAAPKPPAPAASSSAQAPVFPSDNGGMKGDVAHFRAHAYGFKSVRNGDAATPQCAPIGSRAEVSGETENLVYLTFIRVTTPDSRPLFATAVPFDECDPPVKEGVQYLIEKSTLAKYNFARTGISFGGLVVPFKYRVGKDKELVSSPAVAPYVGFRTAWLQSVGITFTPVVAAGLSVVPVKDASGSGTTTKPAYTTAIGFRFTSGKSEAFSAGLIYGRDFVGKAEANADPKLHKPWLSFYLGASI